MKVIVFTRCGIGLGTTSLPATILKLQARKAVKEATPSTNSPTTSQKFLANEISNEDWIQMLNSSKLSFVCIDWANDTYFKQAIQLYQEFLDLICPQGQLFIANRDENGKIIRCSYNTDSTPLPPLSSQWKSEIIPQMMKNVSETNYKPFEAILKCGGYYKLDAQIILWPAPIVRRYLSFTSDILNVSMSYKSIFFIYSLAAIQVR